MTSNSEHLQLIPDHMNLLGRGAPMFVKKLWGLLKKFKLLKQTQIFTQKTYHNVGYRYGNG